MLYNNKAESKAEIVVLVNIDLPELKPQLQNKSYRIQIEDRSAGGAKIFFSAVIAKELKVGDSVFFRNIPTSPADPGIFYTTRGDDCNFVIGDSGSTSGLQRPSPFGSERNYTVTEDGDYSFMIERKLDTSQPFSDESVRIIKASN
ncbi:MAG: hypothetical protein JJT78_04900 [Leptospira sp.]|nr:hypothetical protein [Leptospira sp.]